LISISKKARREELTRIESPGAFLVCNQVYGKGHDMNTTRTFEDLKVWQKAHQLVIKIYRLSKGFPKDEMFGLTSQIRRAAVSVPANVAEGFKRVTVRDKLRFFNIAQASLEEVRYYLILVHDLEYGKSLRLREDLEEVSRMLEVYRGTIKKNM
jgi:four helix bundle protein